MQIRERFGQEWTRRDFLAGTLAAGALLTVTGSGLGAEKKGEMIFRPLGQTGIKVSAIGLGGHHIGNPADESESIRIMRSAIDRGITFFDNCWAYHNGASEQRMGKALKDGYRDKVFLMTKIEGRTRSMVLKQIDESLQRLQVDHVDLLQFHEVIRMEDGDRIFAPGGGMEGMLEAKKAGKLRFIGFTGHKDPLVHLRMLDVARENGFRFDAVQMPLNVMDAHFRSFEKHVLPVLLKEQIGVLGMKSMGNGAILRSNTVQPRDCLRYALSLSTSTVITGMDKMELVDQAIDVVRDFQPLDEGERTALLAKTKEAAARGRFELFKTTSNFDGTAHNPQWLG